MTLPAALASTPVDAERAAELRRVKWLATGVLVATLIIFIAAKALLPLSRMKKGDLVAECESRGLENGGTVAELRARIRIERRQDALVAQLVDRGWSDRRARGALKATSWDVDAAIKKLVG